MTLIQKLILASFITVLAVFCFGIFVPKSLSPKATTVYVLEKGTGYQQIGVDLQKQGIIFNHAFFNVYALISFNYHKLQAGSYELSPSMSVAQIINKMAMGDVVKNTVTIIEGYDLKDISALFGGRKLDKNLEGYLFPDTYELSDMVRPLSDSDSGRRGLDELIQKAKANFDKKLTPDLLQEVTRQKKTVSQIIIMASLVEREVQTPEDKKIVAGILWKRIDKGMPLQVDATSKDNGFDSTYDTYKHYGLPPGPICNPGMDSIQAAIYPTKSDYWYYLSVPKTGQTIFSKTLDEHNIAVVKYLK